MEIMILFAPFVLLAFIPWPCQAGWEPDTPDNNQYCPIVAEAGHHEYFRAAVLEHRRLDEASITDSAEKNMKVFENVAEMARNESVNILVLPEDGVFMGTRESMGPALEEVPDPKTLDYEHRNPCLEPERFENCSKLIRFSCMARKNHLYMVVNYGTRQSCEAKKKILDSVCPDEGFFVLNTDLVLDEDGNYIGRYRKYNLFHEVFHKAPSLELLYFDSPYGRFGVFTCFDMMFKSPAIDLVEEYNIDTAVFPTWWYDELPLLTAIQFQDAWSTTNKVNMLASNIQRRPLGSVGSSIFAKQHSIYTHPDTAESKLLVATLPKRPRQQNCPNMIDFNSQALIVNKYPDYDYTYKQYILLSNDSIYTLKTNAEATINLCLGPKVCCKLSYKATQDTQTGELAKMALMVRDAPRKGYYNWYEQVCALVTTLEPIHNDGHLNNTTFVPRTSVKFEHLSLEGTFETSYVYPVSAYNITQLIERPNRKFSCDLETQKCKLTYTGSPGVEIYSFGLYGRIYERDQMPEGW